jgi:hypothetical protein
MYIPLNTTAWKYLKLLHIFFQNNKNFAIVTRLQDIKGITCILHKCIYKTQLFDLLVNTSFAAQSTKYLINSIVYVFVQNTTDYSSSQISESLLTYIHITFKIRSKQRATTRVTRLGEIAPMGRLLPLRTVCEKYRKSRKAELLHTFHNNTNT